MPVWLRFDLLDGTWLFSDWAQRALPEKTEWMAALVAGVVTGTGFAGAVISSGPRIDPSTAEEDYVGTGGIVWPETIGSAALARNHHGPAVTGGTEPVKLFETSSGLIYLCDLLGHDGRAGLIDPDLAG